MAVDGQDAAVSRSLRIPRRLAPDASSGLFLVLGLHLELGDGSVQVSVRFLQRLNISFGHLVIARIRNTKPQSF